MVGEAGLVQHLRSQRPPLCIELLPRVLIYTSPGDACSPPPASWAGYRPSTARVTGLRSLPARTRTGTLHLRRVMCYPLHHRENFVILEEPDWLSSFGLFEPKRETRCVSLYFTHRYVSYSFSIDDVQRHVVDVLCRVTKTTTTIREVCQPNCTVLGLLHRFDLKFDDSLTPNSNDVDVTDIAERKENIELLVHQITCYRKLSYVTSCFGGRQHVAIVTCHRWTFTYTSSKPVPLLSVLGMCAPKCGPQGPIRTGSI